jgi:hypothetical protein
MNCENTWSFVVYRLQIASLVCVSCLSSAKRKTTPLDEFRARAHIKQISEIIFRIDFNAPIIVDLSKTI